MRFLPESAKVHAPPAGAVSPIVSAHALSKQVDGPEGRLSILEQVTLHVHPGEAVAILGASGSGKSTLLGLLAGLDLPSQGHVELLGEFLPRLDEDGRARLRAGKVGFVFQSFQLLPGLSALENVMLPLELSGQAEARALAAELLGEVGLADRLRHLPNQLSGGEQQRVALARAFAGRPQILFADEPTGNLDRHTGQRIVELLFRLKQEHGTALVLVTHDPALAEHCDRRYALEAGRVAS
jgi:putative ABC transport system ATP-binding protein